MVDFAQARRMMVDSQLRTFDVNDIPLLDAMGSVPRERFVPTGRENLAYIDQNIPVGDGPERRFMLSAMVLGRMIQALEIRPGMRALDVAGGLGYSSAILATLGATVVSLESDEILATKARDRLASVGTGGVGIGGVKVVAGRLDEGYRVAAPYDGILVNGSLDVKPDALLEQLADGGRLVCVLGRGRSGKATLYVRAGDAFGQRSLFDAAAPALSAFQAEAGFIF
jgi:protein-L-isoaspartate(D-aspartate) O-methyltransferase